MGKERNSSFNLKLNENSAPSKEGNPKKIARLRIEAESPAVIWQFKQWLEQHFKVVTTSRLLDNNPRQDTRQREGYHIFLEVIL